MARVAAWLPVAGLTVMVAGIVSGGFQSPDRPRPTIKYVEIQREIPDPPKRVARVERHRVKSAAVAIRIGDPTIPPIARAEGPGLAADGTLRIAASLLEPGALPARIAKEQPPESPGTGSVLPSRPTASHGEQVASLTPAEPASASSIPAWRQYGQKFNAADKRPRIALIVAGTDDNMAGLLDALPAGVTLSLDPYARRLPEWIEIAHARGHEVMLTLSAPPVAQGRHDAGPMAILSSLDPKENLERLDWALDRASGFVGVVDIVGNRPAAEAGPILAKLGAHGLMLVSGTPIDNSGAALPLATGDVVLVPSLSRHELDQRLAALQDKARRDGHAVGIAIVTPAMTRHLVSWLATLGNQSIALAPATAMVGNDPHTGIAQE